MSAIKICRALFHLPGLLFQVGGFVLVVIALTTPVWLTANSSTRYTENGLYQRCVRDKIGNVTGSRSCYQKAFQLYYPNEKSTEHTTSEIADSAELLTLIFIVHAAFFSLIALIGSFLGALWMCGKALRRSICVNAMIVSWVVLSIFPALFCATGLIIYSTRLNQPNIKNILDNGEFIEQLFGYSFWIAVAACLSFAVATIFAVFTSILVLMDGDDSDHIYLNHDRKTHL